MVCKNTPQVLVVVLLIAVFSISVNAEVPNYINYQGRLTDDSGQPVTGSKLIKFKIYSSPDGTDSLWSSAFRAVQVSEGLFNVRLGEVAPLPIDLFAGDDPRYLGITVDTDAEVTPRTQFITVPYAFHAEIADSAKSAPSSPDGDWSINGDNIYHETGNVGIGTTTPSENLVVGNDLGSSFGNHIVIGDDETGAYPGLIIGRSSDYYGWMSYIVDEDYLTIGSKTVDSFYTNTLVARGGNVGINNTSPSEPLSIGADLGSSGWDYITIGNSVADRGCGIKFGEDGTHHGVISWGNNDNSISISTRNGGSYNNELVLENGNIGIGGQPLDTVSLYISNTDRQYGIHSIVRNIATDNNRIGVLGEAFDAYSNIGIYGYAEGGAFATGVFGRAIGGSYSNAGRFDGDVDISGSLSKSSGSFKIDHPLDPENKFLQHSFVESPDMMNVYNGNIILDEKGQAVVQLPEYFEALNKDFRYQLTAIGAPGPDLYIAEEILDSRLVIAGGEPGMKVSWQVTGIRQDRWANEHRIQVEVDKSEEEQGCYIAPELYGYGKEKSINYKLYQRHE